MLTKEQIIDDYTLTFDPGDKLNGSLYIGCKSVSNEDLQNLVEAMRQQQLWSPADFKQVQDEHKSAYKAQLIFVEAKTYIAEGNEWIIACFDHEKYPSDAGRWQAWKQFFDTNFA